MTFHAVPSRGQKIGVGRHGIACGKPGKNAVVVSFDDHLRDGSLKEHVFRIPAAAHKMIENCRVDYNIHRQYTSPGRLAPATYANLSRCTQPASLEIRKASAPQALRATISTDDNCNELYPCIAQIRGSATNIATSSALIRDDPNAIGRSGEIRTHDPCLPKTVLYQAELHSDRAARDSCAYSRLQVVMCLAAFGGRGLRLPKTVRPVGRLVLRPATVFVEPVSWPMRHRSHAIRYKNQMR